MLRAFSCEGWTAQTLEFGWLASGGLDFCSGVACIQSWLARKELVLPCTYNTLNTGKQSRTDKAKSRTDKMRLHAAMHDRVGHHASAPRLTHSFRIAMATDLPSWKYPSRTDWRTLYERPGCIHALLGRAGRGGACRYTKRALLAGVIGATELFMITDYSPGYADTWAALDRRLADVSQLGKAAAQARRATGCDVCTISCGAPSSLTWHHVKKYVEMGACAFGCDTGMPLHRAALYQATCTACSCFIADLTPGPFARQEASRAGWLQAWSHW